MEAALVVPHHLRVKLGADGSEELVEMFSAYQQFATDRYERRLNEVESVLRLEFREGLAAIRVEMERTRADILKWNVLLWIGQFAALSAVMSYLTAR